MNGLRALWIKSVLKLSSLNKLVYAYIQFMYAIKFNCWQLDISTNLVGHRDLWVWFSGFLNHCYPKFFGWATSERNMFLFWRDVPVMFTPLTTSPRLSHSWNLSITHSYKIYILKGIKFGHIMDYGNRYEINYISSALLI